MKQLQQGKKKLQKGFTLIELMIVVAIIGVLSAIAIPAYQDYVKKSEVASAVATLKSLITPAELYYQENGDLETTTSLSSALGILSDSTKIGTISIPATNQIQLALESISGANVSITRGAGGWACAATGDDITGLVKGCE